MTDYQNPSTIDVDEVIANINNSFSHRSHLWDASAQWPNVTVKAMADEIIRLRHKVYALEEIKDAGDELAAGVAETTREMTEMIGQWDAIGPMEWEYTDHVFASGYPHKKALDDLGRDGWELVVVLTLGHNTVAYLKRPRSDDDAQP